MVWTLDRDIKLDIWFGLWTEIYSLTYGLTLDRDIKLDIWFGLRTEI